ncbi:hypothetical protein CJD36_006250 [Flavipsychrobacter stenotrophus]|uniref:Spermidine synthase n=1 Tax=Flavipsychrobacter stenotrophus TaxID=2077091 RepID=A0A2S7SWU2_9BACT|nr:hypothetical protein CJD36_006250 [Flavipsychrobacter stenotrophus]
MWLSHHQSDINPYLELLLYKGRVQLATADALYSDGVEYTPAIGVLNDLKKFLPQVKSVLILGVGLGSTVSIIRKRGYNPAFTLVEIDKVVLRLALEFLSEDSEAKIDAVCNDAQVFVAENTKQHDLLFIDIFNSRTVPDFVSSLSFLSNCRKSIAPGGRVAFNYIINSEEEWVRTQKTFASVFPKHHVISSDINRLFIGEVV